VAQIAGVLGYVFQSPSHMLFAPTVREELAFGPTNLGHKPAEIEKEVTEALRIVNLAERVQDPPLTLSFGQQKRVSIAAILAMRSRILVMDEPTAGQDYQNYMTFMEAILQLPSFEAILFITHDVDLAVIFANRVVVVAEGRLAADGSPRDVLRLAEGLPSGADLVAGGELEALAAHTALHARRGAGASVAYFPEKRRRRHGQETAFGRWDAGRHPGDIPIVGLRRRQRDGH
jgi:energy-coupling factor transport system ATP-binding protein